MIMPHSATRSSGATARASGRLACTRKKYAGKPKVSGAVVAAPTIPCAVAQQVTPDSGGEGRVSQGWRVDGGVCGADWLVVVVVVVVVAAVCKTRTAIREGRAMREFDARGLGSDVP